MADPGLNRFALEEREIEHFERLVYSRSHEQAARYLLPILDRLYRIFRTPGRLVPAEVECRLYTRLAAAAGALLLDPDFKLSPAGFGSVALHHSTLGYMFAASAFTNADHVAAALLRVGASYGKLDSRWQERSLKLLLVCSLDSTIELDLEAVLRTDPQLLLPLYLGMLNRYLFLTPEAHDRREHLLGMGPLFENAKMEMRYLPALAVAWMNCMYATGKSKHAVKRSLNRLVQRLIGPNQKAIAPSTRPPGERPLMLVLLEDFRVGNVNYLTFGNLIQQLRARFLLVGVGTPDELDEGASTLFDRVLRVETPTSEKQYAELIHRLLQVGADIVYYPTIGSSPWCIVMATQRLAPVQVATMGVPATTHSDVMDYVVIEEGWAGEPDCYTETLVHVCSGSTRFGARDSNRAHLARSAPVARNESVVRLAVPAIAQKLSVPFMEACRRIASSSPASLEWHFFAGLSGLQHKVAAGQIRRFLPEAVVYQYLDYGTYLQALSKCDIHLSTFPFGGMNTLLDSLYVGLPIVTLEGREPHERSDAGMMRRASLPEWLVTADSEQYINTVLRLIRSPEERENVRCTILKTPIEEIFAARKSDSASDFLAAFCWLYENHDAIQQSAKHSWSVADREHFSHRQSGRLPTNR